MLRGDGETRGSGGIVSFSSSPQPFGQERGQRKPEKKIRDHEEYEGYKVAKFVGESEPSRAVVGTLRTNNEKVGPADPDRLRDRGTAGG
jgi:hypothetical protein